MEEETQQSSEQTQDEMINLGSSIQLSGFKQVDPGQRIVVKKIVGSQVRKFQDMLPDFERLTLHLKPVHKTEANMQYELHADIIHGGKNINSQIIARNLFMGLAEIFNKLEVLVKK
jgi:hypothetical protein